MLVYSSADMGETVQPQIKVAAGRIERIGGLYPELYSETSTAMPLSMVSVRPKCTFANLETAEAFAQELRNLCFQGFSGVVAAQFLEPYDVKKDAGEQWSVAIPLVSSDELTFSWVAQELLGGLVSNMENNAEKITDLVKTHGGDVSVPAHLALGAVR